jgi:hypothetical protein
MLGKLACLPGRSTAVALQGWCTRGSQAAQISYAVSASPALLRATSFLGAISPHFMPDFH